MQVIIDFEDEIVITDGDAPDMESENSVEMVDTVEFEYSVKVVNPTRMSEYKSINVCKWKRCKNMSELREFLHAKVPPVEIGGKKPDFQTVDVGYIEPGHGMKGKKQWLITDSDIQEMYRKHMGKSSILLWAYSSILSSKPANKKSESTFSGHKENLSEVDKNYDILRKNHGNKYTLEQLRMWAQLIRVGKHDSLEEAPNKPFWKGRKRQLTEVPSTVSVSPTKKSKVSVRSELLDQLAKWHRLNEAGVVSDGEYEDLKKTILSDIKQL